MKTLKQWGFFSVLVILVLCTILFSSGLMGCLSAGKNNSTRSLNTTTGEVNANELDRYRRIHNRYEERLISVDGRVPVESIEAVFQPNEVTKFSDIRNELASLILDRGEWGSPHYYKIKAVYTRLNNKSEEVSLRDLEGESADIMFYSRNLLSSLPEINNEATFFLIAIPFSNGYQVKIRFIRFASDFVIPSEPNAPEDFEIVQMNDGNIAITGYKGTRRHVVIPETLYGQKVTIIRYSSFNNKNIFSVKIPDTVIEIGESAFRNNNLVKVELGNSLKVIGDSAFQRNTGLKRIEISDSVSTIGNSAFAYCGLNEIEFGNGLREIKGSAFEYNDLRSLIIPDWVTQIGIGAFNYNRNLATVTLPSSLSNDRGHLGVAVFGTQFVHGVFNECRISKITLPENIGTAWLIFDESLTNYYESQGKRAGTYIKNGPVWTRINS
jgi:hypothetical protein